MSDTSREAWKQLGAGRELDRVVAEALGYRAVNLRNNAYPEMTHQYLGKYLIGTPQTKWVIVPPKIKLDNKTQWRHLLTHLIDYSLHDTEAYAWEFDVVRYSTSADAALTLLVDIEHFSYTMSWGFWKTREGETYSFSINGMFHGKNKSYWGRADTPALAIVRAFLAWRAAEPDRP